MNRSALARLADVAALGERNQHVRLAGIDHLHVRIVLADHPSEPERDVQIDVLFLVQPADGSGVGTGRVPHRLRRCLYRFSYFARLM